MLRVRTTINSQILSVEAPAWQGAKAQEYQAYSELSQRSQAGCIGAKNVKLFLREPLLFRHRTITRLPPNVPAIFQVTLDIVESRILTGVNRDDIAGDQRFQIAGQFPAAAAGQEDGFDIPVVCPLPINFVGNGCRQLRINLIPDFGKGEPVAPHGDRSGFDCSIQAVEFDIDTALFPQLIVFQQS